MKKLTRSEVCDFLTEKDRFLILTHRRPDGDTLGSAALLCRGLRKIGKQAFVLENPEMTAKYAFLHRGLTKKSREAGDTVICVDTAAKEMLPEAFSYLQEEIALRIDHHGRADSFTEAELVEPDAAACGEIIYGLLEQMGVCLDVEMADSLYTAVSTDTGCFRYANTTENTFRVAAACASVSGNLFRLNQELFDTVTLSRLQVQGWLVENARFVKDGAGVVCPLPKSIEEKFGATEDDLDSISGFPRSIEGVKIATTLREDGDKIKVSVRAVPGYDASFICQKFGGGGHKGAAGGNLAMSMEQAAAYLKTLIEEAL